jgi:hypothetical protein
MTVEHAVPEVNETLSGSAGALTGKSPQPQSKSEPGSKPIKADGEQKQRNGEVGHETRGARRFENLQLST